MSIGPATGTPIAWCRHRPRSCTVVSSPALLTRTRTLVELLARDWHELHLVARVQQKRIGARQVEGAQRRAPDELPAARRLTRINTRLLFRDADRPARHALARRLEAWRRDPRIDDAHVGEPRRESQHQHAVRRRRVEVDDAGFV